MRLTRQRKILAVVLGLGLAAVAMDRGVLGSDASGPVEAAAAAGEPAPTAQAGGAALLADLNVPQPDLALSIAHRLAASAADAGVQPGRVRDAFEPSHAWVAAAPGTAPMPAAAPGADPDARQAFIAEHHLSAVLGGGATAIAYVDGRPIRVGGQVAGCELVEVRARSAIFQTPRGRVELKLAR